MVRIGGFFGKITSSFRTNFLVLGNIIGNVFIVMSGGVFIAIFDALLSNLGFYVKVKVELQNMIGKIKTAFTKEA
ncbi:MAG: hypothetical protein E3J43_06595 [Candidatus Heimdallarchaeota archaeon]|nr:MAG: hypothetical protein E3J43_06595 [Candidatus Heimdallarchaeota archaeon]